MRREVVSQFRVFTVESGVVSAITDYLPRGRCNEILDTYPDGDVASKKVFISGLALDDAQKKYGGKDGVR